MAIFTQRTTAQDISNRFRGLTGHQGGTGDSLHFEKRDPFADSATIRFRYLDSNRLYTLDSSIIDIYRKTQLKYDQDWLSNFGNASHSFIFTPMMKAGWDPGFHAYDIYAIKMEDTRFFTTSRPYTELNYLLGTGAEQQIQILHTQNIKPNWSFTFQYRLLNSPGTYKVQNTNHNNYRINTQYQSPNKRWTTYFVALGNSLQSSENGGIANDSFLHSKNPAFADRFNIPTNLGGDAPYSKDFFKTTLNTGNRYSDFELLLKQQYDFGVKDSLVSDSNVVYLFYPKIRFEYTGWYSQNIFRFYDDHPDTLFYRKNYGFLQNPDTVRVRDKWRQFTNDFSIYQFPDSKNQQQFFKVGVSFQTLSGTFDNGIKSYYNFMLHGEYRNRTRNRKWDVEANGVFYVNGLNGGDFSAYLSLKRSLGQKLGYLQLGFQDVNRTPSFIYTQQTSFPVSLVGNFKKENNIRLFGALEVPSQNLRIGANYYLLTNYSYFTDFYHAEQQSSLFNLLQLQIDKPFKLSPHWFIYLQATFQKTAGPAPLNIPLVFVRTRVAYEGRPFKNLSFTTGFDVRYTPPYKMDNYSPLLGQFFLQNAETLTNRPEIAAFFNFRIRTFTAFARMENLNTLDLENGFRFTESNHAAPLYAYPGLLLRLGIFWTFIN